MPLTCIPARTGKRKEHCKDLAHDGTLPSFYFFLQHVQPLHYIAFLQLRFLQYQKIVVSAVRSVFAMDASGAR